MQIQIHVCFVVYVPNCISNKDHVTNEEVRAKIQQAIGLLPDHRKETQTAVVWACPLFIRFGNNHLARYSERGK